MLRYEIMHISAERKIDGLKGRIKISCLPHFSAQGHWLGSTHTQTLNSAQKLETGNKLYIDMCFCNLIKVGTITPAHDAPSSEMEQALSMSVKVSQT